MPKPALFISVVLVAIFAAASCEAATAVCREPTGRILGIAGTMLGRGAEVDEKDGMTGGLFTVIWDAASDEARVISQGSGGGPPNTEYAAKIFQTDEQISFVVLYESAVWLYSIYPKLHRLLITSHNNGAAIDSGGALLKALQASCEISIE